MTDAAKDWLGLAALGGVVGLLAGAWRQARATLGFLAGVLVRRVELSSHLASLVNAHLNEHYVRYGGHQAMNDWYVQNKITRRHVSVAYEAYGVFPALYRRGFRFVAHTGSRKPPANNGNAQQGLPNDRVVIATPWLLGVDLDALVATAVAEMEAKTDHTGFEVTTCVADENPAGGNLKKGATGVWSWETGSCRLVSHDPGQFRVPPVPAGEAMVLSPALEALVEEARKWHARADWYTAKGIPWRRGWLLHGPPGSGKTQLAVAIARELRIKMFNLQLGGMTNARFRSAWDLAQAGAPCVVLLEDLDGVFHGRTNRSGPDLSMFSMLDYEPAPREAQPPDAPARREQPPRPSSRLLTFDTLLGAIDGPETADGVFLIITTNHPERIDRALGGWGNEDGTPGKPPADGESTRAGRVDRVVEIGTMPPDSQRELARRMFADDPGGLALAFKEVDGGGTAGWVAVKWREWCVRLALSRLDYK